MIKIRSNIIEKNLRPAVVVTTDSQNFEISSIVNKIYSNLEIKQK